jgi:hypothetical protein
MAAFCVVLLTSFAAAQEHPSAGVSAAKTAEAAIRKALDEKATIDFVELPLSDAIQALGERHNINIQIDKKALDDAGLGSDTPISRSLSGISLRSALRLMLREYDLTWIITDEVLLITTVDEAGQRLETQVYDVADLVTDEGGLDYDSLIEAIMLGVAPTTWDEVGGPGAIAHLHGMLIIPQSQHVHEDIAKLLASMRLVRKTRGDKMAVKLTDAPPVDPVAVSVKVYQVQVPMQQKVGSEGVSAASGKQEGANTFGVPDQRYLPELAQAIPALVRPETWKAGGGEGVIYALPSDASGTGQVLVRQSNEVHAQLQKFLKEIGHNWTQGGFGGGFY